MAFDGKRLSDIEPDEEEFYEYQDELLNYVGVTLETAATSTTEFQPRCGCRRERAII